MENKSLGILEYVPHTAICRRVFCMDRRQIIRFWALYGTLAWAVPGAHWVYSAGCLAGNLVKKHLTDNKPNGNIE